MPKPCPGALGEGALLERYDSHTRHLPQLAAALIGA